LPSYYLAHRTDETGKMRFEDGTAFEEEEKDER
jgi:hypothetical protein